jgi:hypothetical protein
MPVDPVGLDHRSLHRLLGHHARFVAGGAMTVIEMVDWKSPTLKKGQGMTLNNGVAIMSVDHVDRTIDPYLAGVMQRDRYVFSGLYSTLAEARKACVEYCRSLG